jgi:phenylpropionate dioxygenase-like ring-hydroxylating dioxygenase large terminal subunit
MNAMPGTPTSLVDRPGLVDQWYVVAEAADVGPGGPPLAVTLLGRPLVLWRAAGTDHADAGQIDVGQIDAGEIDADQIDGGQPVAGQIVAAPDRCPHREAPLSQGSVDDGRLVCRYHGWTFGAGGRCVLVPSSGEGRPVPPAAHLPIVRVVERYGLVWVSLGEPRRDVPHLAVDDDPSFRRINSGVEVWATSATRMTDNFLDIAHFPYVHVGTFGIADRTEVPPLDLEPLDDDFFGYRYDVEVANTAGATASGSSDAVVGRHMTTGFHLPFTVRSTIRYEHGLVHVILLCSTPIDDVTSYFTFVVWRNDDGSVPADEVIAFDRAIGAEDRAMLERIPGVLPLESTATVSVQSDRASVEWRRRFADLAH